MILLSGRYIMNESNLSSDLKEEFFARGGNFSSSMIKGTWGKKSSFFVRERNLWDPFNGSVECRYSTRDRKPGDRGCSQS